MIQLSFWGDCKIDDLSLVTLHEDVRSILNLCDYNIVNFEAPVHSNSEKIIKSGPSISQNTETPAWLEDNGFNVISLANNHIMDYGIEGLQNTKKQFTKSLLIGAGDWLEAYKVGIVEKDGYKIGFLALTHLEFGVLNDRYDKINTFGSAWILDPKVPGIIHNAKKELDFLIVLPHAGIENIDVPLPEWREIYKGFIESGADAVIASHPHVPQGWELYNNKPVFYSLGNFCFQKKVGQNRPLWNDSLCVVLRLSRESTIDFEVKNITYRNDTITLRNDSEIHAHTKEINRYLLDDDLYVSTVNQNCNQLYQRYLNYYSSGGLHYFSGVNLKFFRKVFSIMIGRIKNNPGNLINNIRCESHRWAFLRAMKLRSKIM